MSECVAWRLPMNMARRAFVRHSPLRGALACLLLTPVVIAGCVVPPSPGSSGPPVAEVLPADARALAYGRSAGEVLENPQLRDKVRALFGGRLGPTDRGGVGRHASAPRIGEWRTDALPCRIHGQSPCHGVA